MKRRDFVRGAIGALAVSSVGAAVADAPRVQGFNPANVTTWVIGPVSLPTLEDRTGWALPPEDRTVPLPRWVFTIADVTRAAPRGAIQIVNRGAA